MSADRRDLVDTAEERRLLADVASLQSRPELHDVTFVCGDGVSVRANRAFIAARSEFFDRLLYGDLCESKQSTIHFPNASSAPLCLVFEYLHTCRVTSIEADTMAVEAYDLAEQYNLPGLQRLIVDYLVSHARENARIGPIMSTALRLRASDIAETILPVVSSALEEGRLDLFDGFSVDALVFSLSHQSLRSGWPNEIDILKSVLHWAVERYGIRKLQLSPSSSSWGVDEQWAMTSSDVAGLNHFFRMCSDVEQNEWLTVLRGVRFEKIPTHLIKEQIEPLGVVPTEILLRVYCNQASRFATVALKSSLWDPTCRGSEVRIEQDLCDFQCKNHQGVRVQTQFVSGVHCWDIIVERYCDLVWVGVVSDGVDMNDWLGKQKGGWMFGSNGTLCHDTQQDNGPYSTRYGAAFRDQAHLTAKLDMNKRELGFSINGIDYGVAFTNLPAKVYPAVSCRTPGVIRVSFGDKLWALIDDINQ